MQHHRCYFSFESQRQVYATWVTSQRHFISIDKRGTEGLEAKLISLDMTFSKMTEIDVKSDSFFIISQTGSPSLVFRFQHQHYPSCACSMSAQYCDDVDKKRETDAGWSWKKRETTCCVFTKRKRKQKHTKKKEQNYLIDLIVLWS